MMMKMMAKKRMMKMVAKKRMMGKMMKKLTKNRMKRAERMKRMNRTQMIERMLEMTKQATEKMNMSQKTIDSLPPPTYHCLHQ